MPKDDIAPLAKRIRILMAVTEKRRDDIAREIGVSKANLDRIFLENPYASAETKTLIEKYLENNDVSHTDIQGRGYGYTEKDDVAQLLGNYRMYSPNSLSLGNIEAFGAVCSWKNDYHRAEFQMNTDDPTFFANFVLYKPVSDSRTFLKRSWKGWNVMYVINPMADDKTMNGVALRMDTVNPDKHGWDPVLFPVAFKKIAGSIAPYEDLTQNSEEYGVARDLIERAMRGNNTVLTVWQHWRPDMPGNPAGGPRNP